MEFYVLGVVIGVGAVLAGLTTDIVIPAWRLDSPVYG
jgi:hypothetical protein